VPFVILSTRADRGRRPHRPPGPPGRIGRPAAQEEMTMRFAMLICGDEARWDTLSPSDEDDAMKRVYAWFERWQPTGKIADGGAELQSSKTAKTVRQGADGQPVVTDGPYLEAKEVIGGVVILECDDIDDAVAVAATWPLLMAGSSVEVRPVMVR
jgi:hypothetical protein